MIHVIGKYGIDVGEKCYAAGKISKVTNKKKGVVSDVITAPAYCTSMQSALSAIRKRMQLDTLRNMDCELNDAVEAIRALDERFENMIKDIKF